MIFWRPSHKFLIVISCSSIIVPRYCAHLWPVNSGLNRIWCLCLNCRAIFKTVVGAKPCVHYRYKKIYERGSRVFTPSTEVTTQPSTPAGKRTFHQVSPSAFCGPSIRTTIVPLGTVPNRAKLKPGPLRKLRTSLLVVCTSAITPTAYALSPTGVPEPLPSPTIVGTGVTASGLIFPHAGKVVVVAASESLIQTKRAVAPSALFHSETAL
jgi:hypothetical protein